LLSVAAVVSLALGLFQDFGATPEGGPLVDWVEGIAIIAAILIVVTVGSLNDWQKERQFQVFNEKKEDRLVKVIRDGAERHVDVHEVVVGDVALLEPGDVIPCDGILLSGRNVRCDESAVTGESDAIKKVPYEECIALRDKRLPEVDGGPSGDGELPGRADCFIVSGTQVLNGLGSYVVIAVGTKSFNGRIMMGLFFLLLLAFTLPDATLTSASRRDSESTPLQLKLDDLAEGILKIAYITGGLLLVSLSIRYLIELGTNDFQRYFDASSLPRKY
jgi:Ca2+-transporting ATPase